MARLSIGFGVILIALGVGAYFGTGRESWTALIPALLGAIFVILGFVALNERTRKHAMHGAVLVAVIGIAGSIMRPLKTLFSGEPFDFSIAVVVQFITAGLCLVFLVLAVRSFVGARMGRPQA